MSSRRIADTGGWRLFSGSWFDGAGNPFTPGTRSYCKYKISDGTLYVIANMTHTGALGSVVQLKIPCGITRHGLSQYDCAGSMLFRNNGAGTWPVVGIATVGSDTTVFNFIPNSSDFNTVGTEQRVMANLAIPIK